jgi:hypothetical protein
MSKKTIVHDFRDFNGTVFAQAIEHRISFFRKSYSVRVVTPGLCVPKAEGYCKDREFPKLKDARFFAGLIYDGHIERIRSDRRVIN